MLIRLILKIWPALLPILLYLLWVMVIERLILQRILKKKKSEKIIEGEYKVVGEKSSSADNERAAGQFSLQNPMFVKVLYLSLIALILTLIFSAIFTPKQNSYKPAEYKDGKIVR